MITLPPPRRAHLIGFWLVITTIGWLGVTALLLAGGLARLVPIATAAALVLAALGVVRPRATRHVYRAWNIAARAYAAVARAIILRGCFHLVFGAIGLAGSRLDTGREARESMWIERPALAEIGPDGPAGHGWILGFVRWAGRSSNVWAVCLVPFLVLIRVFAPDGGGEPPASMYTLF